LAQWRELVLCTEFSTSDVCARVCIHDQRMHNFYMQKSCKPPMSWVCSEKYVISFTVPYIYVWVCVSESPHVKFCVDVCSRSLA